MAGIPRIAYTCPGQHPSPIRAHCVRTFRHLNPDWCLLCTHGDHPLERLDHLESTGGVWLDASCLHLKPIESWLEAGSADLQGFWQQQAGGEAVALWALACRPRNQLVRAWAGNLRSDQFADATSAFRAARSSCPGVSVLLRPADAEDGPLGQPAQRACAEALAELLAAALGVARSRPKLAACDATMAKVSRAARRDWASSLHSALRWRRRRALACRALGSALLLGAAAALCGRA